MHERPNIWTKGWETIGNRKGNARKEEKQMQCWKTKEKLKIETKIAQNTKCLRKYEMKSREKREKKQAKREQAPHMNVSTTYIRDCSKTKGKQAKITQKTKYLNKG